MVEHSNFKITVWIQCTFMGVGYGEQPRTLCRLTYISIPCPQINTDHVSWKGGQYLDLGLQGICRNFIKQNREVWLMYGFGVWILWLAFNRSEATEAVC